MAMGLPTAATWTTAAPGELLHLEEDLLDCRSCEDPTVLAGVSSL